MALVAMCERSEAMREVREACDNLAAACIAGIDLSFLRVGATALLLDKEPADFRILLAKIDDADQHPGG